jgi:hypothetical protein
MIPGTVVLVLILIVIQQWISIPSWLFWNIIGVWIAKDIIMFPYVWRAHDMNRPGRAWNCKKAIGSFGLYSDRRRTLVGRKP